MKAITMRGDLLVQAMADRKTVTRRPLDPQPQGAGTAGLVCKYGKPGDLLYVPETHFRWGCWREVPGVKVRSGRPKWEFVPLSTETLFEPPGHFRKAKPSRAPSVPSWYMRSARIMPKDLARLVLEVVDVALERLLSISADDAIAEGLRVFNEDDANVYYSGIASEERWPTGWCMDPRDAFFDLWDSIYGEKAHKLNPWVWVVRFKRVQL